MRETWDKVWSTREAVNLSDFHSPDHLLNRLLGSKPGQELTILEVGCGGGLRTMSLVKYPPDGVKYRATLTDFSPAALAFARKNARANGIEADFVLANGLFLPFRDGSFDVVWNEGVNEHFDGAQRQRIFNEMARVCKLDGQVIVIVPNSLNLPYRFTKKVLEKQKKWIYGFEKPYSVFELKRRIKKAGLTPVKTGGVATFASLAQLWRIFAGDSGTGLGELCANGSQRQTLRRISFKADRWLGVVGVFTGMEIGVKGIKPQ